MTELEKDIDALSIAIDALERTRRAIAFCKDVVKDVDAAPGSGFRSDQEEIEIAAKADTAAYILKILEG